MMTVKQVIFLPAILISVLLVMPVSGYQYSFQNDDDFDDWTTGAGYPLAEQSAYNYADTFCVRFDQNALFNHKISYPTNYWAFTDSRDDNDGGTGWRIQWYDENNVLIGTSSVLQPTRFQRVEIIRSGSNFNVSINGSVETTILTSSTIPYYFTIQCYNTNNHYIDDLVIGTTEEHDIIGTPPHEWFVCKDIFDPGFSGLYSAPNTQVYTDTMHVSYGNDDGEMTLISVSDLGTGTVWNTTTISGSYAGVIAYNLTEMLFDAGAPYGFYSIQSSGTDAYDTFVYKAIATTGTTVLWDETSYEEDDTATMTYTISASHWVTDDYRYYLKILGPDVSEIDSWEITLQPTNATQVVTVDTTTFPVDGTYYCALYAQDRSSLEDILLEYDDAYVDVSTTGDVTVSGTTFDAVNATALGSCTVSATQAGSPHTETSNAIDGSYSISGLTTDFSIGMNASKTNWRGFPTYFTPYEAGTYTVDIPLVPWVDGSAAPGTWEVVSGGWATQDSSSNTTTDYWNATTDGTGLGGIIYNEPYWTTTSGATVTVSNATFNATKTTGDGGWYQFNETVDGICGGTYTITVSKTGYSTVTTTTTLVEDWFTRKDLCLGIDFTLTVNCRELTSNALITDSDVYVELDTGDSATTTTGIATFSDVEYGVVGITASAVGYYPGTGSVVVDSTTTTTVYLQKEAEASAPTNSSGFGVGYAPKTVRFTVQTIWGKPIENCLVNATGYETTVGDWDWLYKVFGIDVNETPIATCTMGGYTDYKGDINFVMLEPVQYNCTFVKAGEINTTMSIYPKDDYYVVYATDFGNTSWLEGGSDINEAISVNVTKGDDGSTGWINISYTDTSGGTTGGTCYLNQTNPLDPDGDETVVDSYVIATNNWSENFTALAIDGEAYHVHVDPVHSTWDFERSYVVNFPKEKVNPLGLSDQELMMLATFLILFTGLLFGAISAPHAPLIMSFMGWIFLALGWLDAMLLTATAALTLATVLSVLTLVMVRSKKERFI